MSRYRWAVLAAGTVAQATFSAFSLGLPVLAPAIRDEYQLDLAEVGVVLASAWVGTLATLLAWGFAADRLGERAVLSLGLASCGALLAATAYAPDFAWLVALIALAGAAGASVNSASGRAVMHWFSASERGLALGVRQTAIVLGGLSAALVLPHMALDTAFLFLAGTTLAGALVGGIVIRERSSGADEDGGAAYSIRDARLWRLCIASGLYVVAQIAVTGFVVLFLHDERGLTTSEAAGALAAVHVGAAALRIAAGRWSDALRARIVPLRRIGIATAVAMLFAAVLLSSPAPLAVTALVVAGSLSAAWNGLSFAAAAELAGRARSGAAIGLQQSVLSGIGAVVPIAFAAVVSVASWRAAYALAALSPLLGWWALRPLSER